MNKLAVNSADTVLFDSIGPIYRRQLIENSGRAICTEELHNDAIIDIRSKIDIAVLKSGAAEINKTCSRIIIPRIYGSEFLLQFKYELDYSTLLCFEVESTKHGKKIFAELGEALGRIHNLTPIEGTSNHPIINAFDHINVSKQCAPDLSKALLQFQSLVETARSCVNGCGKNTLLHGRWSMGVVFIFRDKWVALSGAELWHGPPEYDLGYMIGELVELAAQQYAVGNIAGVSTALEYISVFLETYGKTNSFNALQLEAWTAHRLISHLLLNAIWRFEQIDPMPSLDQWVQALEFIQTAFSKFKRYVL